MTSAMDKRMTFFSLIVYILVCWTRVESASDCAKKFTIHPGHTACLSKSGSATTMAITEAEKGEIVTKHNTLRANVNPTATNMMKMSWDDELAMIAQKWIDSCPVNNGQLSHDKTEHRFVPGRFAVGQNMAYGPDSWDKVIQLWYDEVKDYTYGTKASVHKDKGLVVGHYTQVVWADSVKVGCGRSKCVDGQVERVVYGCNYGPAGNMADYTEPYKSGTKGADCKTNDNGLCDCSGLVCWNRKTLDRSTCTCDCGSRYIQPECSLNCDLSDGSHCGPSPYDVAGCSNSLAHVISSDCPKQCGYCPSATKGFGEETTTPSVTTAGVKPEITTAGVKPEITTQGVTAEITTQGVTAEITTQGVTAEITTQGVTAEITTQGVTAEITTQGVAVENTTDDDGASTAQLCFSLFVVAIFSACLEL